MRKNIAAVGGLISLFAVLAPAGEALAQTGAPALLVDKKAGTVELSCAVAKQGVYGVLEGRIEFILTKPGGKSYESLLTCDVGGMALLEALKAIGLSPGRPASEEEDGGTYTLPAGDRVLITAVWTNEAGVRESRPVEALVKDLAAGKPLSDVPWVFTGSAMGKDPETRKPLVHADITGNLISLHHREPTVLIQNGLAEGRDFRRFKPNEALLPPEGAPVLLILGKAGRDGTGPEKQ